MSERYIKTFDCDHDYMYMEFSERFYNENKEDIDILLSSRMYEMVDEIDRSKNYSLFNEDDLLEIIYCYKQDN